MFYSRSIIKNKSIIRSILENSQLSLSSIFISNYVYQNVLLLKYGNPSIRHMEILLHATC